MQFISHSSQSMTQRQSGVFNVETDVVCVLTVVVIPMSAEFDIFTNMNSEIL